MDEIVKAALKKWPSVPACWGWLGLDARGDWWLRDAATQAAGEFPAARGSRIEHRRLVAFIGRNYAAEADGAWFFQNGPQKVYVDLEAAPWIARLRWTEGEGVATAMPRQVELTGHTGQPLPAPTACRVDPAGRLFLVTSAGLALVHSLDMDVAADALVAGLWPEPVELATADILAEAGCRLLPRPG